MSFSTMPEDRRRAIAGILAKGLSRHLESRRKGLDLRGETSLSVPTGLRVVSSGEADGGSLESDQNERT